MAIDSLQEILGKAITDNDFRQLLFDNPDEALKGYELDDQERAALSALEREQFDLDANEIEERISRAGLTFSPINVATIGGGSSTGLLRFFDMSDGFGK